MNIQDQEKQIHAFLKECFTMNDWVTYELTPTDEPKDENAVVVFEVKVFNKTNDKVHYYGLSYDDGEVFLEVADDSQNVTPIGFMNYLYFWEIGTFIEI